MNQGRIRNDREHNRRTAYIIVEYRVKEGVFRDILKNLGASGLFVNTKRGIVSGQPIELTFPLFEFDHPVKVRGNVVRSGTNGFAVALEQPIEDLITNSGKLPEIVHEIDRVS
jgi:hypothetical protein